MSTQEFYAARTERIASREIDFGVWWRLPGSRTGLGRLTWIERTGEFYLESNGQIRLLGTVEGEQEAERALAGWDRACGKDGGLDWVASRISMAADERARLQREKAARSRTVSLADRLASPRHRPES